MKKAEDLKTILSDATPYGMFNGAVYSVSPIAMADVKSSDPVATELVFDMDMNDYDDVRKCCEGKTLCSECWE